VIIKLEWVEVIMLFLFGNIDIKDVYGIIMEILNDFNLVLFD
jgi:hypothetical protein